MKKILSDNDTYEKIDKDPTKKLICDLRSLLDGKVDTLLTILHIKRFYTLLTTDGNIPRVYGLTKIYKQDNPLRIIVLFVNSPLYYFSLYIIFSSA